jgi:hypothetical protein
VLPSCIDRKQRRLVGLCREMCSRFATYQQSNARAPCETSARMLGQPFQHKVRFVYHQVWFWLLLFISKDFDQPKQGRRVS